MFYEHFPCLAYRIENLPHTKFPSLEGLGVGICIFCDPVMDSIYDVSDIFLNVDIIKP
jgi:hypothetical protein